MPKIEPVVVKPKPTDVVPIEKASKTSTGMQTRLEALTRAKATSIMIPSLPMLQLISAL